MKKQILSAVLAGVMASATILAGCGGSSSTATTAASAETKAAEETTGAAADTKAAESSAAAASGSSDVDYIKGKGTLIVGITDFEPMDYKDDSGKWIGFDADLATKVAEDLGVEVKFEEIDWDNKILEMQNKSIDVVWNGMTLTDEVTKSMDCTDPYLRNAQVVVLPTDVADKYKDISDMKDLSFAVEAGSAGEEAAQENGIAEDKITEVPSQADALMGVQAGTSDAAIIDLLMAGAMIGEGTSYPNLTHTAELSEEEYGIGCRQGSDLKDYINEEMQKFKEDGSLKELAEKYGVQDALID
jgi:polar amino acid transport system substrate-binding protein